MADQRTTDLDPIATIPDSAVFDVVDTTNTTQDPAGSSFKITKANLLKEATAAILLNTAKVGVTTGQAAAILLNTAKVGITTDQAAAILLNTAKVGITVSQAAAILLNTAKTGITTTQASAIVDNTAKVGITTGQVAAILLNTAKVGITTGQAAAILLNTNKVSFDAESSTRLQAIRKTILKYTLESQLPTVGDVNVVYFLNISNVKTLKYWDGTQYLNASEKALLPNSVQDFFIDFYATKAKIILSNYAGKSAMIAVIEDEDNQNTFTHYFYNGAELQWMVSVNQ